MPHKDPDEARRYNTEYHRRRRAENPERAKAKASSYYLSRRTHNLRKRREYIRRLKVEVITAYGGACRCCGEREIVFLTVDHVRNDGAEHRRKLGSGTAFYLWLKRNGFPRRGFRLLCMNCNWGRALNGGRCPHKRKR